MDFQERIADFIETLDLGIDIYNDNNSTDSSIAIYSLPGGSVIREYYDGTKDKKLNYEVQAKTRISERSDMLNKLNIISQELENLQNLTSNNNSFQFQQININNETYLSEANTEDYIYFRLEFEVRLTIYGGIK